MSLDPQVMAKIRDLDPQLIRDSQELAEALPSSAERQIRNIMEAAEQASCWEAVELFIRYQAARGALNGNWAEALIAKLKGLEQPVEDLARQFGVSKTAIHLALIARFLGYLVRWDVIRFRSKAREARDV
ncbi:hypothetical protein [Thermoflexus hugenholtzii]